MALTLAESAKLSNDVVLKGVIETVVRESAVLQKLPFMEVQGNALTYNREDNITTASWYTVDDIWSESTPTFTQLTAVLKILGADADVDEFIQKTRSNIQDIAAEILAIKAKAVRYEFERTFIYGNTASNSKEFDGIRRLINTGSSSSQVIAAGASGATLTLAMLDRLIDAVPGGKPDLLLMSRRSRRKITALVRAASAFLIESGKNEYGNIVDYFQGIPIGISDWILDTHTVSNSVETGTTGGANSVIYALRFGMNGLMGIQNGSIQVEPIGKLESKDASRWRIKWYCGLADFSLVARAALIGVQD